MQNKISVKTIKSKKGNSKIVMATSYDSIMATWASQAGVDIILVGDSLGNTVLGYENTLPVKIEDMIHHTKAVANAKPESLILADIPFGVAHYSFDSLLENASRLIQEAGANAVKIEGGKDMAEKISKLVKAGIPVAAHIGLEPQQVNVLGGYKKFGKTTEQRNSLIEDALCLEKAGAFCIIVELTDETTTAEITSKVSIPVIGIGSGSNCDGQVLVITDLLAMSSPDKKVPSFVKQYACLFDEAVNGLKKYADEVRQGKF